jgi:putative phosphoesterase
MIPLREAVPSAYRIGVLSDTHFNASAEALAFIAELADTHFAQVDLILHAGDIVAPEILLGFTHCPVLAVRGNMDPASPDLPVRRVLEVSSARIGLTHGWGPPADLETRLLQEFAGVDLDVLIYGHSHRPACCYRNGILLFNPGSAGDRRQMPCHTVGILDIGDTVRGEIIRLD